MSHLIVNIFKLSIFLNTLPDDIIDLILDKQILIIILLKLTSGNREMAQI